jgi:NADH dehydrogenase FAD-containing subunit
MTDTLPTLQDPAAPAALPGANAFPQATAYKRPVRLVLWGAGPAHLRFLRSLQKNPIPHAEIILLTQHTQVLQPRKLAAYIANEVTLAQCLIDVEPLLGGTSVRWSGRQGRAMDAASRTVLLDDRQVLNYDVLSINIGPQPHREAVEHAMPGAREHGLFVPPLEGFVNLWPKVCDLGRSRALRIAVVGHCTAGFELALAVRQRMPTASVTWVPAPQETARDYTDALFERMLNILKAQRVTVLYDPVAAFSRDTVELASGAQLTCDVPLLVLSNATPAWLKETGLECVSDDAHALGVQVRTDAQQRSISHPEVFFVQQDSLTLGHNLRAVMESEPARLRPLEPPQLRLFYAGASHGLAHWHGKCYQGRWVGWLKKMLKM